MSYKDTLTLYEELVSSGVPVASAKIQAHQMGAMSDYLGDAINRLNTIIDSINTRLDKIENDMFWMRLIGGAMTVTFFSNGFFMWLAK